MLVTIIPNFALFSYFTTDRFHYQLYGHLARCLKTHEEIWVFGAKLIPTSNEALVLASDFPEREAKMHGHSKCPAATPTKSGPLKVPHVYNSRTGSAAQLNFINHKPQSLRLPPLPTTREGNPGERNNIPLTHPKMGQAKLLPPPFLRSQFLHSPGILSPWVLMAGACTHSPFPANKPDQKPRRHISTTTTTATPPPRAPQVRLFFLLFTPTQIYHLTSPHSKRFIILHRIPTAATSSDRSRFWSPAASSEDRWIPRA